MRRRISLLRLAPLAAAVFLTACSGTRKLVDPVVVITTRNGMELGVTTDSGVVFTNRAVAMCDEHCAVAGGWVGTCG